jgi:arylsulfatase A-like enzyme
MSREPRSTARAYARACALASLLWFAGCVQVPRSADSTRAAATDARAPRPNILVIVADDMGPADLGSFGGEIPTPNLDALAREGVRLTNFHVAPACSPTRAMLLTGVDPHRAGHASLAEDTAPNQQGKPGYEGQLPANVVTLAERLRDVGYRTLMTGKWHLGTTPASGPAARGFDRSFTLITGGASHFADMRPAYAPTPDAKANYWEDGRKLDALPPSFEYSSQFYVDRLIEYLDAAPADDEPFFAYLAFTAPHWPLQAPDEAIARHAGRYDAGWDALAAARLARQQALGIVPANATLAAHAPRGRLWSTLNAQERRVASSAMEVYAAMIDEMDRHVGRLLEHLRARGRLDDTIIVFLSDNGPEGHDLDETWPADHFPDIRRTIDTTHDFSLANMGRPGSYTLYGPDWARAGTPSLRLYKGFPTEGGIRAAAFLRYPARVPGARLVAAEADARDLAPTLLELAGIPWAGGEYRGRAVEPISGRSLLPLLSAQGAALPPRATGMEFLGKRAFRSGRWKIVHMPAPHGSGDWQLYDLEQDPGERQDLAAALPERVAALRAEWEAWAAANQVVLPDWVSGY